MSRERGRRLAAVYPRDLPGENAGLYGLHVGSLVELLEPLGWTVDARSVLDPFVGEAVLAADLAVIQMLGEPEVEAMILRRRELGRPTIFELTDNFLAVADWLPRTHTLRSPLARQSLLYHAHLADALQMLVPGLAELFARVNPRTIVLDPYVPIPPEVPPKPDGFVVGWAGSTSHAVSLAASAPAVVELCRRHPDATFAYMGSRSMFEELFGAIPPAQTRVHPFGTQEEHLRFTGGLHVGIAPMSRTPFNETRADTRVCLYAGHGVAAVLEDAPAHRPHRDRARLYRSRDELLDALEELYADRAQVDDLARRGREWVVRERSRPVLGAQRERAYAALLDGAPAGGTGAVPLPDAGRLRARLLAAHAAPPDAALATCREVLAEQPRYEQAHLLAVQSLERLRRYDEALEHVDRVAASPVYADLFAEIAARLAKRVRPSASAAYAERIHSPFRRARAMGAAGEGVLEHQPYDYFALASTIKRLGDQDPAAPALDALYERLCLVAPENVPAARTPAALERFLAA